MASSFGGGDRCRLAVPGPCGMIAPDVAATRAGTGPGPVWARATEFDSSHLQMICVGVFTRETMADEQTPGGSETPPSEGGKPAVPPAAPSVTPSVTPSAAPPVKPVAPSVPAAKPAAAGGPAAPAKPPAAHPPPPKPP